MKKDITIILFLSSIFLLLGESVFAQTATLISYEKDACIDTQASNKTFEIDLEIVFEGNSPFGAWIRIENAETGDLIRDREEITSWLPTSSDDIWRGSVSYTPDMDPDCRKIRIIISRFRDSNSGGYITNNISGEVIISLYNIPIPIFNDAEISGCGTSIAIEAVPGIDGNLFSWSEASGAGTFEPYNNPTTIFTVPDKGNYTVIFTQTNGSCAANTSIDVNLFGAPKGILSTNTKVCGSGNADLVFDLDGFAPFDVNYTDGTNTFPLTITSLHETISHSVNGMTEFTIISIKDDNGCEATSEDMTGVALVIDLTPNANAGSDEDFCGTLSDLMAIEPGDGMTGRWSSPSDDGVFDNEISAITTFLADEYGTFTLRWTVTNEGCSNFDEVEITFWEAPLESDAYAGADTLLYYTSKTTLNASEPRVGRGLWTVDDFSVTIQHPENPKAEATGLNYGETEFTWTITNGVCPSVYDKVVITIQGLRCPTGFSPNGDGANDLFVIEGADQIKNNQLIIFDKDGYVIFKQSNYSVQSGYWDGTKNGTPVPDGIYHYVFSGDDVEPIKNFLVLKRTK